jgi:capsular polysaccharide transport system permease protein
LNRLSNGIPLPIYENNYENLLSKYTKDLTILYDDLSGTLEIKFMHANANQAHEIVKSIIKHASKILNFFEKKNTEVALSFLQKQEKEKHALFLKSLEKLLIYQNKHKTINPQIDIEAKSTILAGLEADLIQRNVEYNSKAQYLNKSTPEMKLLKRNIAYIEKSIRDTKRKITGSAGKGKLNISMSDFSLLKSKVEFDKNIYMQTLIKLEETKVLISQNTKNIIIVSASQVSDCYSYPNKIKDSFSVLIVLSFIYGILALIFTIIRDHKD